MKVELNVLFKKIQKDDKKEVLEFHVQGDELPSAKELIDMAGNMTVIEIEGCEAGKIPAEFKSLQRDSKKTALKFNVKGDSDGKVIKLYKHAGTNVALLLEPSQMTIDEFYEDDDHEGIEYTVDQNGNVEVPENQISFDDVDELDEVDDDDILQ